MNETVALVVAAGRGERARTAQPKQYRPLGGKPVLRWTVETFAAHPAIDRTLVVIQPADRPAYDAATAGLALPEPVPGGATRMQSVRNGLEALAVAPPARVLIHDAARPFASPALITRVIDALDEAQAAAPLLAVADTLRQASAEGGRVVPRHGLARTQTPQGFWFDAILAAHRAHAAEDVTDDLALAEHAGLLFAAVAGEEMNFKLTTPADFVLAERIANGMTETRIGNGFDVHRFTAGDHVWLCGVRVPHDRGLEGHSDADAPLHALTDAILGAMSAGDIGMHFPPSESRWAGAPSHLFLEQAAAMLRDRHATITQLDVTIVCERPKIGPYREAMRARIAAILAIAVERVSVKATTTEGLGFTGRGEGLAAQATATIKVPAP